MGEAELSEEGGRAMINAYLVSDIVCIAVIIIGPLAAWSKIADTRRLLKSYGGIYDCSCHYKPVPRTFRQVANLSGGYLRTFDFCHYFIFGSYPDESETFSETGAVYVFPRGDDPGYETTLAELAERGIMLGSDGE